MKSNQTQDIVEYCRSNGMQLWLEEGKLRYKAPEVFLQSGILNILKSNKEALMTYLQNKKEEIKIVPNRAARYEPFLLSDVQSAYVLGRKETFSYGGVACHNYMELKYDRLDLNRVNEAWNKLIERHDMLRAVMYEDGRQQVLLEHLPFEVECYEGTKEEKALEEIREKLSHRVYPLGKWPMFSVALSQYENKSILHFSIEFLIADWTSVWSLLSEFETLYFNPDAELEQIDVTFRDYLFTEKKLQTSKKAEEDKTYWLEQLEDLPMAPKLPILLPNQAKNRFKRYALQISQNKWETLKRLCGEYGITPTTAVLSTYAEVLGKWSTEKDFTINMTVLNRKMLHKDIGKVIGDFTTLSLVGIKSPEDVKKVPSFAERSKAINKTLFENLDHSEYSGVEVIRQLGRRNGKDLGMMPYVFTSAIGLLSQELIGEFEGVGISQTPQVFIDCQAMDSKDGLRINWDIREGIFPPGLVEDMFDVFKQRLLDIASSKIAWDEQNIGLPLWQEKERRVVNDTHKVLEVDLLYKDFLEYVKRQPNHLACVDEEGSWTYNELHQKAQAIAYQLIQDGAEIGSCVGILISKSRYQVAAVLGILYAGCVYVPISVEPNADKRRCAIIEAAQIKHMLVRENQDFITDENMNYIVVEQCELHTEHLSLRLVHKEDPAYIIFTSGTTGTPKGVVISHQGACNTIKDLNTRYQITCQDTVLGLSELNFDLSVYDIFGMLSVGGNIVYPQSKGYMNAEYWTKLIKQYNITIWNSVPALMQIQLTWLQEDAKEEKLPLRYVFLSGDWIPVRMPEMINRFSEDVKVICMGGATEASIWSILHEYTETDQSLNSIPYGKPMANQGFQVLDEDKNPCPVWKIGQLYITGIGLAIGYINDPVLTKEKFITHPITQERIYATGDLGRYLPGGEIEFIGRIDDQVKIRGYRIELGEIENAYTSYEGINAALARVDLARKDLPIQVLLEPAKDTKEKIALKQAEFKNCVKRVEMSAQTAIEALESFDFAKEKEAQNEASYCSMLCALKTLGISKDESVWHPSEIDQHQEIQQKYKWVLWHWIYCLEEIGWIKACNGGFMNVKKVTNGEEQEAWEKAETLWRDCYGDKRSLTYFRTCSHQIIEVITGKVDPIGLLYPDGSDYYPRALYVHNIAAMTMSQNICYMIREIRKQNPNKRLRILEIGGGTGATTQHVLKLLEQAEFEYYFTDISKYFFSDAEKRFGNIKGIKIQSFNLDLDIGEQGLEENYFDVIIAAYVLNNVKDIDKSLERIEKLAAPGGYVMFSEPMAQEPTLMISQAFLMTKAEDEIREKVTFIDQTKWLKILERGNYLGEVAVIPSQSSILKTLGAGLYVKQYKIDYKTLNREHMRQEVHHYLPQYMIPSEVKFKMTFPLTPNGKIDRKKAFAEGFIPIKREKTKVDEVSRTPFEGQLLIIWKDILKTNQLSVKQSFYDFGADSLIMAQSVTRIKNELHIEVPFDVLLRHLLNYPTVRELADFLEAQISDTNEPLHEESAFAFIKHHGGDEKDGLRVCIHGALGTVECYQYLVPLLVEQDCGTVLTISVADMAKYCAIETDQLVSKLADLYTELLLKRNPKKVQLIGYSFSGSIVIEIARRLIENDVEVDTLNIIDGGTLPVTVKDDIVYEWLFIDSMKIQLKDLGFKTDNLLEKAFSRMAERNRSVLEKQDFYQVFETNEDEQCYQKISRLGKMERMKFYAQAIQKKNGTEISAQILKDYCEIYKQSFASLTFVPDMYFGDIRYFASQDKEGAYKHFDLLLDQWKEMCIGEFEEVPIAGNHYTCIEDKAHVINLASLLDWRN